MATLPPSSLSSLKLSQPTIKYERTQKEASLAQISAKCSHFRSRPISARWWPTLLAGGQSLSHILLPSLVLLFLLPSLIHFRLEPISSKTHHGLMSLALLGDLLELPVHRIRLSVVGLAEGRELIDPNEASSYMSSPSSSSYHQNSAHLQSTGQPSMRAPQSSQQLMRHQQSQLQHHGQPDPLPVSSYGPTSVSESATSEPGAAADYAPVVGDQATSGELGAIGEAMDAATGVSAGTQSSQSLQTRTDLPAVRALNVKCEKNHMLVNIVFDRPFFGLVFSKGHYNDQKCVHLPANSGQTTINFDIHLGKCGMSSSEQSPTSTTSSLQQHSVAGGGQQPHGLYIENTIIIQYDPQVQEIYDQARKLRCTWYDYYEKSVTFRPYNVDMLDAVTANFLGDNIQCWMQIQVGKGPWSSEVAGIVKIGQTMTMVLAIKDDENRFDMLVRNCMAHDGKHQPIQLVDEYGCVARPKIMSKFQKVRNFGPAATVVSYAHFQAFKFPDSMSVHFQCVIQVCRYECPEPVCAGSGSAASSQPGIIEGGIHSISGGPGAASSNDYAASGTELVSAKELPLGQSSYNSSSGQMFAGQQQQVVHSLGDSAKIRLDESLGRVQVKLDTSMMANAPGQHQRAGAIGQQQGSLAPQQLLRATSAGGQSSSHAHLSSSFFKPPLTSGGGGGGGGGSKQSVAVASGGRGSLAPSSGHPAIHYSSPYSQHRTTPGTGFLSHRLGEVANQPADQPEFTDRVNLGELGSPRGLRSTQPASNHRYRRQTDASTSGHQRAPRHLVNSTPDSTAIQTQKTIQVVSPDDVAFSLLSPAELASTQQVHRQRHGQVADSGPEAVCFSASKLILALLVTVGALVGGISIVIYWIWWGAGTKFVSGDSKLVIEDDQDFRTQQQIQQHFQRQQEHQQQQQFANTTNHIVPPIVGEIDRPLARQQAELEHRNSHLARIYSQFVPANYWRR